jgi:peptidoglycan/LPS O-acetylase OafA/YrhL
MVVFLFVVFLLILAGLLGVVLKAAILLMGTAFLAAVIFAGIVWYWVKHQVAKAQRAIDRQSTNIRIGQVRRSADTSLPPARDDRY